MAAIRVVISGRVQGVGFRAYVSRLARTLGCTGEVWNRIDRRVEAIAVHDHPDVLNTFSKELWGGPGHVTDIARYDHPDASYDGFEIGLTR
jgi:acylphosphatase